MKYKVTRFKSLALALKALEPFIRDGQHLLTGKPLKRFGGLRSRELVANWLVCVVSNSESGEERLTFSSDPLGGDGILRDSVTEGTWATEHVLVPPPRAADAVDAEEQILKAIGSKQRKGGEAYASGKILVVFLNAENLKWFPNKVSKALPEPLDFVQVWVAGLRGVESGKYVYSATILDISSGNAPTWLVRIGKEFDSWSVERLQ